MTGSPLVSILIPCYNVGSFLEECIDSLRQQTYDNLQIVMIDDGSSDNTWELMRKLAARDSRIEIYTQENRGVASTRNRLLDKVRGEYVLFIDSDDWVQPEMVEYLVMILRKENAEMATCGMVVNDSPVSSVYSYSVFSKNEILPVFLFHNEMKGSLCNKMFSVALMQNVRFCDGISYGEDALFCWHLLLNLNKVVVSDRELYHYRMNSESISHQSFGSRKLSGHRAWQIINEDVDRLCPQFRDIARARWGLETLYLLRQAGQSNYEKDDNIRMLQKTLRRSISQMKRLNMVSAKELINALIVARCYSYCLIYNKLHKLKSGQFLRNR